jgi:hypothetical protein
MVEGSKLEWCERNGDNGDIGKVWGSEVTAWTVRATVGKVRVV